MHYLEYAFYLKIPDLMATSKLLEGLEPAAHGLGGRWAKRPPLSKISHTYPTMMKLGTVIPYLKKIQKIYESRDTPPGFC